MMFRIRHTAPVWEETLLYVDAPNKEWVEENYERLLEEGIASDEATIQVTTGIEGVDSDVEVEAVGSTPEPTG